MPTPLTHQPPIITVDVEDWPQSSWDRTLPVTARAAKNTRHLLQILRSANVRVTMFVQGKFAEAFPDVVREIVSDGHEIASHGYGHVEIFEQSPREFRGDVRQSKQLLEQISGQAVVGYRAPDFSVLRQSLWALDILADQGFLYDSSIYPIRGRRYGIPDWPLSPTNVSLASGMTILEFPLGTYEFGGRRWPVGGGGYSRLLPGIASRTFARSVLTQRPFVFYCHPYEFDPQELKELELPVPLSVRLHQGLGRGRFERRFVRFLCEFGGWPVREWLQHNVVKQHVDADSTTHRKAA